MGRDEDAFIGQSIEGKYFVTGRLRRGGMSLLYLATDKGLDREVVVKVLQPELQKDEAARRRFKDEARAAEQAKHENVVHIISLGETPEGMQYIVMEYIEGKTLDEWRTGWLGQATGAVMDWASRDLLRVGLRLFRQIAETFSKLHSGNVVHRDIKPGNVMVVERPADQEKLRVKILDFGIAKADLTRDLDQTERETGAGETIGTPIYMAPEQIGAAAGEIGGWTDVYSLGVLMYEFFAGRPPFRGRNAIDIQVAHRTEEPAPLSGLAPGLPGPLVELIHRMLAKKGEARPPMQEVAQTIQQIIEGEPPPRPTRPVALYAGTALALTALTALSYVAFHALRPAPGSLPAGVVDLRRETPPDLRRETPPDLRRETPPDLRRETPPDLRPTAAPRSRQVQKGTSEEVELSTIHPLDAEVVDEHGRVLGSIRRDAPLRLPISKPTLVTLRSRGFLDKTLRIDPGQRRHAVRMEKE